MGKTYISVLPPDKSEGRENWTAETIRLDAEGNYVVIGTTTLASKQAANALIAQLAAQSSQPEIIPR